MSHTSLVFFKDGKPDHQVKFRNSWGGAARIWDSLFNEHLKRPDVPYDSWLFDKGGRLWALIEDPRISEYERVALGFTFDLFYVSKKNFRKIASHLREFASKYPVSMKVDHLDAWAGEIEKSESEAVGLYASSVGENLWKGWDNEKGEEVFVPLSCGHEVYEYIENLAGSPTNS